jgi:hypothetical protein
VVLLATENREKKSTLNDDGGGSNGNTTITPSLEATNLRVAALDNDKGMSKPSTGQSDQ